MGYRFNPYKVNPYIIHVGLNILLSLNDDDDIHLFFFLSVFVPCTMLNNYYHHLIAEEIMQLAQDHIQYWDSNLHLSDDKVSLLPFH